MPTPFTDVEAPAFAIEPNSTLTVKKIFLSIWKDTSGEGTALRWKVFGMISFLLTVNVGLLLVLSLVGIHYQTYFFTGLLAYGFGLRHAVDADHIAAIDNTVRKLVQEGKQPVAVGFFFSLGHSTIVFGLSCAVAFGVSSFDVGNVVKTIGVSVSASFLIVIGFINLLVFVNIVRTWRQVVNGRVGYDQEAVEEYLAKRGFMNRCCGVFMKTISKSWHMYFLGLLFGLGFDTATEVALLAISASAAGQHLPAPLILLLPLLFASGMCLIDTLDGILMIWCYGWAFIHPIRKLYYNMTVTLVSVFIAFSIGILETLGIVQSAYDLQGPFWDAISATQDPTVTGIVGGSIIGLFLVCFAVSAYVYRVMRYDELLTTSSSSAPQEHLLDNDSLEREKKWSGTVSTEANNTETDTTSSNLEEDSEQRETEH